MERRRVIMRIPQGLWIVFVQTIPECKLIISMPIRRIAESQI